ncbi:alpha/beta hydrolase [Acidovorax sp. Be4]|uniref:Alpha/beta hydrolase n=1 Tax=Acidovorax bellezanensis TaxID=2976702 RepID=A0ABT2PKT3_9BURK|nr:alpha/beta hydrolase [Acidovorax sp. Be4]MCT9810843.1 alpha/beta hydrolase [Acidovorax sp. Be4]
MQASDNEIRLFKQAWTAYAAELAQSPPSLIQQRQAFDQQHGAVPVAEGCEVHPIRSDTVQGELIIPAGADRSKALVYHHGGGYTFGSALSHRHLVSRLAKAAGVVAYNMDYRLAPEHPYPLAIDDALAAYRYVRSQGFDAADLVFAGESAGGNLTAALLLRLRSLGLEQPAGAYLLSPWLDMTQSAEAYETRAAHDPMLSRAALDQCMQAYCAGHAADDPMISPVKADLAGLPALFLQVGSDEVLLSDAMTFAQRAAHAGIGVRLHVWPEMVHAWPLFHPALPTAGLGAIAEAGDWIASRLGTR